MARPHSRCRPPKSSWFARTVRRVGRRWMADPVDGRVLNALRCLEEGLRRVAVRVALRFPLGVLFPFRGMVVVVPSR